MKEMFYLIKMTIVIFGGIMIIGCEKDDEYTGPSGEFSEEVTTTDERYWGESAENWLSEKGILSYLNQFQDLTIVQPSWFDNLPSGVKLLDDTYVYITKIRDFATLNSVLGYYTYTEEEIRKLAAENEGESYGEALRALILDKIFVKATKTKKAFFTNVVYARTKNTEFATTFRIDNKGEKLEKGTIIGFYLLPNGGTEVELDENGQYITKDVNIWWDENGNPLFTASNREANITKKQSGNVVSHMMGKSSCGDLVISFEDMNIMYTDNPTDNDFNDLVFVIGDNLKERKVTNLVAYNGSTFQEIWDPVLLGEEENCVED